MGRPNDTETEKALSNLENAQMLPAVAFVRTLVLPIAISRTIGPLSLGIRLGSKQPPTDRLDRVGSSTTSVIIQPTIALALLIAAGRIARKQTIAAIPPEFDPASYQCRLLNAMHHRGYYYREIKVLGLEKKMQYWSQDQGLRECFTIKGLMDSGSSGGAGGGGVYDVVIKFWEDGRLNMRFCSEEHSGEDCSAEKPGLILEGRG
ncbi:hypothetical protein F1880_002357 [Penicillium rolfsii]|nr:hypothetical protein F1880_002357 [Penicillium rolfsii]